jgi:xylulokinase
MGSEAYPVDTPHPGWAEQHPDAWIDGAAAATRAALKEAGINPGEICGIGLSGQMHGTVCLNAAGDPVRPAIIWADQRSSREVTRVRETLGKAKLAKWTGNPLATGFMLASWLWLERHEAETIQETISLLLPKDYVRYRLTGIKGSEPSDASSTLLFNPRKQVWSESLARALDLDVGKLPPISPSTFIAGGLMPPLAERFDLKAGTPVILGGSDQAMQAFGNGVIEPGTLSATIGTGGQLFAPTADPVVDPDLRMHSFCHVVPNRWHVETATLSAGLSLRWLKDQIMHLDAYGTMADAAVSIPAGAEGLIFQPYLAGERTPHMDPEIRGSFAGLTRRHSRPHMIRAVMEGVIFAMRQGMDLMLDLGVPIERVLASGGGVRHPLWLQLQADIFNRPIHRTTTPEAAAKGAAMLAGVGLGIYPDAQTAVARAVQSHTEIVEPNQKHVAIYKERYPIYCNLYQALADISHQLTPREIV